MHDPFIVVPVRHLGHGLAISAAFGPMIYLDTRDLLSSIGTGYIILHAIHKAVHASGSDFGKVFFDTLIFDSLASALLPTILTYHVRWIVRDVVLGSSPRSDAVRWVPTAFSLASLVFTWSHIDNLVHDILNQTLRSL
ncbi:hypothetical protein EGW08_008997 [Elysia chlorotica]|uniref:Uncharacterized protein n=1 Tax=Elysia chlorotica TaxID=188477 RepID=A0A433TNT0_ELYCH|nr:hypothetical protein EGW08_008997 [Elysia chlorotica]